MAGTRPARIVRWEEVWRLWLHKLAENRVRLHEGKNSPCDRFAQALGKALAEGRVIGFSADGKPPPALRLDGAPPYECWLKGSDILAVARDCGITPRTGLLDRIKPDLYGPLRDSVLGAVDHLEQARAGKLARIRLEAA